jgi:hypothetical protein
MPPEIIIALIASVIPMINNGVAFIAKLKESAEKDTEWTEEERAAFKAELDKLTLNPEEWQKVQPL